MSRVTSMLCAGVLALAAISSAAIAAERVGQAVKINVTITGAAGTMTTGDPVHRNERVRANASGVGQFQFRDGTKLVIGPNASIVVDRFVLGEGGTVKKLTIRATKGTFRWLSGKSPPAAYSIVTPAGTLGVRGTAVEVQVGPGGQVMVVQLEGQSEFCVDPRDRRTCRLLKRRCDFIVADPRTRKISDPAPITAKAANAFGGTDSLPFLRDNSELLPGFKLGRNECNMSRTARRGELLRGNDRQPGSSQSGSPRSTPSGSPQ